MRTLFESTQIKRIWVKHMEETYKGKKCEAYSGQNYQPVAEWLSDILKKLSDW